MAKPVTLNNGKFWPTQTAAKAHFRAMLGKYANGQSVVDSADHDDLLALVEIYDGALKSPHETKAGPGIRRFFRDADRDHPGTTDCFFIERIDGSKIDFSFHKAIRVASQQ